MKSLITILLAIISTSPLFSIDDKLDELRNSYRIYRQYGPEKAYDYCDSLYVITKDTDFMYQKAVIMYGQRSFAEAIPILNSIKNTETTKEEYFQLLGSCYDFVGQKNECMFVLNEGLVRFPESGRLHYELGNAEIGRKEREAALAYWEKGVAVDPAYENNYYRLAKYYAPSEEKLVSLIYGEIFILISTTESKTQEVSKIVYDIYTEIIEANKKGQKVKLASINPDTENILEVSQRPFIHKVHKYFSQALNDLDKSKSGMNAIIELREMFLENWSESGYDLHFPNASFDYQLKVIDKADFKAYTYIILSAGNQQDFIKWAQSNREDMFIQGKWMQSNPLKIDDSNSFYMIKFREE